MRQGFALAALFIPLTAGAVPGPDSTVVLSNAANPDSVLLGQAYATARQIPAVQVCSLDLPQATDMSLKDYQEQLLTPLKACMDAGLFTDRIEAVVIMRGVPLRVSIDTPDAGSQGVSLAAALALWKTTYGGVDMLGLPPGRKIPADDPSCPNCYAARFFNLYDARFSRTVSAFAPGWNVRATDGTNGPVVRVRPLLVTMLNGRTYDEAAQLIDSAHDAETDGVTGDFMLMKGADPARGALDFEYDDTDTATGVQTALEGLGIHVARSDFNPDLTGKTFAGFVTGTAGMGDTIEGNTYLPGSLVDNLTSFGAHPLNFTQDGEVQVSIARWVGRGAAGAHGTTDEPLNNVFPSRFFLVRYAEGFTLAESYFMDLPFMYWRNLVLGDPMLAPYAVRPAVTVALGDCVHDDGTRTVQVTATSADKLPIDHITLLLEGQQVGTGKNGSLSANLTFPAQAGLQLLAVAQKRATTSQRGRSASKGWAEVRVDGTEHLPVCMDTGMGGSGGGGAGGTGGSGGATGGSGGSGGISGGGSGGGGDMPGGSGGLSVGGSGGTGTGAGGSGGSTHHPRPTNKDKASGGGCSAADGAGLLGLAAVVLLRRRKGSR